MFLIDEKQFKIFAAFFLVLIGAIAYSNSFSVPFLFDDFTIVRDNPYIRDFMNLSDIWKFHANRFIANFTLALNYSIHGNSVGGYHLTNLTIHLLTSYMVFKFFLEILQKKFSKDNYDKVFNQNLALFLAGLFCTHPIQTQAVTYIAQRHANLVGLFYISSMYFYFKYLVEFNPNSKRWSSYFFFIFFGILASFTKQNSFTLPFVLLLINYTFFPKNISPINKHYHHTFPIVILILIVPLIHFFSNNLVDIGRPQSGLNLYYNDSTSITYFLTQLKVLFLYLKIFLWPANQAFDYDIPVVQNFDSISFFLLSLHCVLFFGGFYLIRINRLLGFGIVFYYIAHAVESSFNPLILIVQEHRMYIPMIGICSIIAAIFMACKNIKIESHVKFILRKYSIVLLFSGLLPYTTLTFFRNCVWESDLSFWQDNVKKAPNNPRNWYHYGYTLTNHKLFSRALEAYEKTLSLRPIDDAAWEEIAFIQGNLGNYRFAVDSYKQAIFLSPLQKTYYYNLGVFYFEFALYNEANKFFREVLQIYPDYDKCRFALAQSYFYAGDLKAAYDEFTLLIAKNPGDQVLLQKSTYPILSYYVRGLEQ